MAKAKGLATIVKKHKTLIIGLILLIIVALVMFIPRAAEFVLSKLDRFLTGTLLRTIALKLVALCSGVLFLILSFPMQVVPIVGQMMLAGAVALIAWSIYDVLDIKGEIESNMSITDQFEQNK